MSNEEAKTKADGAESLSTDGLGASVIGCIGHDGDCCKDRDAEKIDAARYRWLRRQPWVKTKGIHAWGALLDSAIDEARHDAPNV